MKGYSLFVMSAFDTKVVDVIDDIMDGENFVIGFNRKKGGMDVHLPIDLSVANTVVNNDGSLKRVHSQEAINGFRACFVEVTSKLELSK